MTRVSILIEYHFTRELHCLEIKIFRNRSWLDNLITINATQTYDEYLNHQFLSIYRNIVNQNLVYMNVNTKPQTETNDVHKNNNHMNIDEERCDVVSDQNPNNLYLTGFSEQVFHCLANICNGGGCSSQVAIVENIDKKHNLPYTEKHASSLYDEKRIQSLFMETAECGQKWRKLKVFISSTFEVGKC